MSEIIRHFSSLESSVRVHVVQTACHFMVCFEYISTAERKSNSYWRFDDKSKPHFLLVQGLLAKSLSLSSCSFMISLGREAIKVLRRSIQKT